MIKRILNLTLLFLLSSAVSAEDRKDVTQQFIKLALQGDLSVAHSLFSGQDTQHLSSGSIELSRQFQSRFVDQVADASPGTGDALADSLVTAYRTYWKLGLTGELSGQQAGIFLEKALAEILASHDIPVEPQPSSDIYQKMGLALTQRGFHFLEADAPPFRDLFLWKTEEVRRYSVRLTDGSENVDVVFLSDLFSLGWKEYATFGLAFTTGWVTDGRLYCIDWAYDRQSEKFEVSYLKHESRHLADFRDFPGLSSADLEYRAKLTELAFASTTALRLMEDFSRKSIPNPQAPHAYANYRVTRDIYRQIMNESFPESTQPWAGISTAKITRASRSLLEADSSRLRALSR